MTGSSALFASLAQLSGLLFAVAILLLWLRTRSPWLLAGLVAASVSLLCRLAFLVADAWFVQQPALMGVWQLTGLVEGSCLLGYAISLYSVKNAT